ncbi:SUMF1/EgtB/PvdO family nonheme iron enzyme [Pedobacter sp. ASV28]|uniref:type IX secretion system lipoprotein PorK/GldK n=1 Tax=Pedobacter sp. ASV28 TaxID=2795123 RepID=UPI0018EA9F79|nr:SUMF1/EgtB/PvdO family nonheme iron enzyme [Pedobacter sp. ASV28]
MKKIYFLTFIIISAMLSSCGKGGQGELIGAYNRKFKNNKIPLGMVYIPGGRNLIGMTDEDITFYQGKQSKMVSFNPFYMDQTEITNAEYRQFVNWVRDSVAITKFLQGTEYFIKPKTSAGATAPKFQHIDWRKVGNGSALWNNKKPDINNKLKGMYINDNLSQFSHGGNDKDIDKRLLRYAYISKNIDLALQNGANSERIDNYDIYTDNPDLSKPNQHPSVLVYPDTLVWRRDYTYEYNDPMVEAYFNHPSYDRYPVVGVTWEQANAFCAWRTEFYENVARQRKMPVNSRLKYALPTEAEFEYAARGGRTQTKYPWGGPYIMNARGCLQANFKVGRGNYVDDGALYTVEAKAYLPNDYGLYNMAGNVAEWTLDAYNKASVEDKNPIFRKGNRKVVKGGSWKDIGFFLQNSVASYEYQDVPRSYIGFRCVSHFPGNSLL